MEAYFKFLQELRDLFDHLSDVEREKMVAVQDGDLDRLNDCIRREQALSLTLRGMDHRREELLQGLGLGGTPLRELPDRCPPEFRQEARVQVEDTLRHYEVLTSSRESARTVLECGLRKIDNQLRRQGVEPELDGRYQSAPTAPPPGLRTDFHA